MGGTQRSRAWQGLNFESHNTPAEAFRTLPPAWRPRGIRMFISDCLWLGDPLEILQPMADAPPPCSYCNSWRPKTSNRLGSGTAGWWIRRRAKRWKPLSTRRDKRTIAEKLDGIRKIGTWRRGKVGGQFVPLVAEDLCRDWDLSPLVRAEALAV